jgi:hypothetical protein
MSAQGRCRSDDGSVFAASAFGLAANAPGVNRNHREGQTVGARADGWGGAAYVFARDASGAWRESASVLTPESHGRVEFTSLQHCLQCRREDARLGRHGLPDWGAAIQPVRVLRTATALLSGSAALMAGCGRSTCAFSPRRQVCIGGDLQICASDGDEVQAQRKRTADRPVLQGAIHDFR